MRLKLTKPVMFFDLETTGTNILHDRIVEMSMIKVYPERPRRGTYNKNQSRYAYPGRASSIHHIFDEDVADKPAFKQVATQLAKSFEGCDIAGFNSNKFDIPMLAEEFARAGVDFDFSRPRFIDVQTIFHKKRATDTHSRLPLLLRQRA